MRALLALARAWLPEMPDRATRARWLRAAAAAAGALAAWLAIAALAWLLERRAGHGAIVTGYALLALMIALGAFNLRKRLPALPIGTARAWMLVHLAMGVVAVPLFLQHAGGLWPAGRYEQAIALAFYATLGSGVAGWALQRILPRRLTDIGGEVVFERIPAEIAAVRESAEGVVLAAMQASGSSALGRYYAESFDWYFWRPRFLLSHLMGANRSARWIRGHIHALRRYLGDKDREALDRVEALALRKNQLDAHYVLQGALKLWLFVHVPAAALLLALALWHLALVNIYAL